MRSLHRVRNIAGVYIPKAIMKSLGWDKQTILMVWQQNDVLCIKELKEVRHEPEIKIEPPMTWREWDRERQVSIFEVDKKCT